MTNPTPPQDPTTTEDPKTAEPEEGTETAKAVEPGHRGPERVPAWRAKIADPVSPVGPAIRLS